MSTSTTPTSGTESPLAALIQAADFIEQGAKPAAEALLNSLVARHSRESQPTDLQTVIFARALLENLGPEKAQAANLYLERFALPQISLFDVLAQQVPLVTFPGRIVNSLIADALAEHPDAVLVDVGMGSGRQEMALLSEMAERGMLRLTMIGIEPAADCLQQAEAALRAEAARLGVNLEFVAIAKRIEDFEPADWARLEVHRGRLVLNEAFTLHHVLPDEADGELKDLKDDVIRRLYDLQPLLFLLTEPHSDHEQSGLAGRLAAAWEHFGATFRHLDALPGLGDEQRSALKTCFFAREIMDILQLPNGLRVERHETAEQWLARLRRSGFQPLNLHGRIEPTTLPAHTPLEIEGRIDYVSIGSGGQTIVSIIGAEV